MGEKFGNFPDKNLQEIFRGECKGMSGNFGGFLFYSGIRTLEKPWTKCISVAGEYVEK